MSGTLILIGGGGNLGRAVARRFGAAGFHVALIGRNPEKLLRQASELQAAGTSCEVEAAELTDLVSVDRAVKSVVGRRGAPAVVVYNAAVVKAGSLLDTPPEAIERDLLVNVGAAMAGIRAALPSMIAGGRGTVLLTGGGLAREPRPAYASLSVGKFGLNALAQCLAHDPAFADIHVAQVIVEAYISEEEGERIAALYLDLHQEPKGAWRTEVVYRTPPKA